MFVKSCNEIIALGCSTSEISWRDSAEHLEPTEFHEMLLKHAAQQARAASTAIETGGRGAGCADSDESEGRSDANQTQPLISDESVEAERTPGGQSAGRQKPAVTGVETDAGTEVDNSSLVLLDCRNLYESEIGRFDGAVRCPTRHFTEFPAVADRMVDDMHLRDKTVLMYCTGGIRCERASAYLRSVGVRRCFQLKGGIARYCEAFPAAESTAAAVVTAASDMEKAASASHLPPAGSRQSEREGSCSLASACKTAVDTTIPTRTASNTSMFRGKNFVFDRRMALQAGPPGDIVGECVLCEAAWDQYDRDVACEQCSALVLVCETCRPRVHGGPIQLAGRRKRKQTDRSGKCGGDNDSDSGPGQILCTYCRS